MFRDTDLRVPPFFRQNANTIYNIIYEEEHGWWRIEARPLNNPDGPPASVSYIWPNRVPVKDEEIIEVLKNLSLADKKEDESKKTVKKNN